MFKNQRLTILLVILLISALFLPYIMLTPVMAEEGNISIDMRDADIRDVLSAIAVNMGKNIIFTGNPVSVNFSIQDVKPKIALDYLLNTVGFTYIEDNNTLIVGLRDTLNKEFYSKISLTKFVLKYVTSDVIALQIDALGIPVKKLTMDGNKKIIWVQGLPQELSKVNELIYMLDRVENVSETDSDNTLLLTPLKMNYISAEQMNNVIGQLGMYTGIVIESDPMTLWVYGNNKYIEDVKNIQQKVDIANNAFSQSINLTPVKMSYLTTDEIIPILYQLDIDIRIISFKRSLQTIWLSGNSESIKLATEVIKKFDIKDHINDNIFFIYKTVNITAQELKNRFDNLDLENVKINYLNYPEFSKSLIIHCPADFKLYVMNHINKLDVTTDKIKVPIDYSDVAGGMTYLTNRRNLLVELTGIPEASFTISNNVSRDGDYYYIMYLEESQEKIKLAKDYVKYIDDPLTDGIGN